MQVHPQWHTKYKQQTPTDTMRSISHPALSGTQQQHTNTKGVCAVHATTTSSNKCPPVGVHRRVMLHPVHSETHRRCRRVATRAAKEDTQGKYNIEFGKPQVGREVYEAFAITARDGMMEELQKGDDGVDVVMAALQLACEDDAIKTRTHIALPVASFSKRLDTLATECGMVVDPAQSQEQQLSRVLGYLYSSWGMKLATEMYEGSFSPYRVYMQNVLSQKCGTQASVAAVVHSLLKRMHETGRLGFRARVAVPVDPTGLPMAASSHDIPANFSSILLVRTLLAEQVAVPFDPTGLPVAAISKGQAPVAPSLTPGTDVRPAVPAASLESGAAAAASSSGSSTPSGSSGEAVRWATGSQLLVDMLDQLKRFYWSWYWPVDADSGFEECASVLLTDDRAGKVNAAVGVMQRSGRPFGDVGLSVLACERLVQVLGATEPDSWQHLMQMRDYGIMLLHTGKLAEGKDLLSRYLDWLQAGGDAKAGAADTGKELIQRVLSKVASS